MRKRVWAVVPLCWPTVQRRRRHTGGTRSNTNCQKPRSSPTVPLISSPLTALPRNKKPSTNHPSCGQAVERKECIAWLLPMRLPYLNPRPHSRLPYVPIPQTTSTSSNALLPLVHSHKASTQHPLSSYPFPPPRSIHTQQAPQHSLPCSFTPARHSARHRRCPHPQPPPPGSHCRTPPARRASAGSTQPS